VYVCEEGGARGRKVPLSSPERINPRVFAVFFGWFVRTNIKSLQFSTVQIIIKVGPPSALRALCSSPFRAVPDTSVRLASPRSEAAGDVERRDETRRRAQVRAAINLIVIVILNSVVFVVFHPIRDSSILVAKYC